MTSQRLEWRGVALRIASGGGGGGTLGPHSMCKLDWDHRLPFIFSARTRLTHPGANTFARTRCWGIKVASRERGAKGRGKEGGG